MIADIFTHNKRISDYLERALDKEAEVDASEPDSSPLYSIRGADMNKIDFWKINKFVSHYEIKDIRLFGGYEIRDSKTGEFLEVMKSLAEVVAPQSMDN